MKAKDLTGQTVGRLYVLKPDVPKSHKWFCLCECGRITSVKSYNLTAKSTNSCGCLEAELKAAKNYKHGYAVRGKSTPEYTTWKRMKSRCFLPTSTSYKHYGGRGITMCSEWAEDFTKFFDYVGERPSKDHSIERINVNGNYEPGNVRWATFEEQMQNTRQNRLNCE